MNIRDENIKKQNMINELESFFIKNELYNVRELHCIYDLKEEKITDILIIDNYGYDKMVNVRLDSPQAMINDLMKSLLK